MKDKLRSLRRAIRNAEKDMQFLEANKDKLKKEAEDEIRKDIKNNIQKINTDALSLSEELDNE